MVILETLMDGDLTSGILGNTITLDHVVLNFVTYSDWLFKKKNL